MPVEKVFYNANILTQDKKNPLASAFAVEGNKIVAVGSDEEILQLQTSTSKLQNLNGKTILPGFNDAHIHLWKVGNLMTYTLDLRGVRSMDEMQQKLLDYARENPGVEWIQARGFNEALFDDRRMPTKHDIDKVISDRAVCVMRTDAHQVIVNTKALEKAGITEKTVSPPGGEIKKFPNGELKGHFTETAIGLVLNKIPAYSSDEYRTMILSAQEEFIKVGITSVTDPAVMPDLLEVYKSMDRNGELKIRVNAIPIRVPDGAIKALPLPDHYTSDFLRVNTVKFFSDGGLSGKTAAMKHPYKNSGERGVLRLKEEFFRQLALEVQQAGFRIATHAIGDEAIDLVLKVYSDIFSPGQKIHHRIEHLGFLSEQNMEAMKEMSVSAVMQPIFIFELGKNFRENLTDDYLGYVYPSKSVLNHGINLALSTDAPVVKDFNPMMGIQSALERKDAEGFVIAAREKISVEEAIRAYTMGSAVANGDQDDRGSISEGKFADFVVLDKNPLEVQPDKLYSVKMESIFIGGSKVF